MYLNKLVFNSVFCLDDKAALVDARLARLFEALKFVELRHFRMPAYLVNAIESNTSHFAAAVSALYALQDRHTEVICQFLSQLKAFQMCQCPNN